jgi:fatty acid desaturase
MRQRAGVRRRRSRRDWVVSAPYIASVIVSTELTSAFGPPWYILAAYFVASAAVIAGYYRVTR